MIDIQRFVIQTEQKIVDHYTQLLASSTSEPERERYRERIDEHEQRLQRLADDQLNPQRLT